MTTTLNASTAGAGGFIATSDNSGSLALQTAGTTAVTIDTSQNVGIGTTSPAANPKVTIKQANDTTDGGLLITSADGSGSAGLARLNDGGMTFRNAGAERMRITSAGDLVIGKTATGIGTQGFGAYSTGEIEANAGSNPAAYFNRTNDGTIMQFRRAGTTVGTISVSTGATAYNTSSDYRLKENIAPMTGALAKVAQLKPVTYKWKADDSDGEGFIAHELAEVVPHAVNGDKDAVDADGNPVYQGIDTSFLVATLTAALQETKALIDTQAETINALTARIVALEGA
jgi:hypothetical protein